MGVLLSRRHYADAASAAEAKGRSGGEPPDVAGMSSGPRGLIALPMHADGKKMARQVLKLKWRTAELSGSTENKRGSGRGEWIRTTDLLVPNQRGRYFAGVCTGLPALASACMECRFSFSGKGFPPLLVCTGLREFARLRCAGMASIWQTLFRAATPNRQSARMHAC